MGKLNDTKLTGTLEVTENLKVDGNLEATGNIIGNTVYGGNRSCIFTDAEGGQLTLLSPNDYEWSIDAHTDHFRLYTITPDTNAYHAPIQVNCFNGDVAFESDVVVQGKINVKDNIINEKGYIFFNSLEDIGLDHSCTLLGIINTLPMFSKVSFWLMGATPLRTEVLNKFGLDENYWGVFSVDRRNDSTYVLLFEIYNSSTTYMMRYSTVNNVGFSSVTSYGNNQRLYTQNGCFLNGNSSIKGHGTITVNIMPNGIARIDYFCKISSSGTSNTDWQWGINRDLIKAIIPNCPTITPISGGYNVTYLPDGTLYDMINGYGGSHVASNQFWCFGRAYQINGSDNHLCDYGGWQENLFTEGMRIIGTCYGVIN